jgi:hypothetical protein
MLLAELAAGLDLRGLEELLEGAPSRILNGGRGVVTLGSRHAERTCLA